MKKRIGVILVMGILLFGGRVVSASPITIQISGTVTSTNGSALPDTIYEGVSFTGSYTYDSSVTDSQLNDPQWGQWGLYQFDAPCGMSITVGGYEFKTASSHAGGFEMEIINDEVANLPATDYYTVFSDENVSSPFLGFPVDWILWNLRDYDHTALSSDTLPVTAPILTDWEYNYFEIHGWDSTNNSIKIRGTVTQAVLVPEPLTGILMITGVFFLRNGDPALA